MDPLTKLETELPTGSKRVTCPRCHADWKCPCASCTGRRSEDTIQTWQYNEDRQQCLTCGFEAHLDWWLDYDFACFDPEKHMTPQIQEEIVKLSQACPDWRKTPEL